MKLLIATRNAHKLDEIRAILSIPLLDIVSMDNFPDIPDVVEDGDTFETNALKKAVTLATTVKLWTLADDSGLEVEALEGKPGVRSARYAGEPVDYRANNKKLLRELKDAANRGACFRCVIALAAPSGGAQTVEGKCAGGIPEAPRGSRGFGYDPVFVPDGYDLTFAEMEPGLKNSISHRAAALKKALSQWGGILRQEPAAASLTARHFGRRDGQSQAT